VLLLTAPAGRALGQLFSPGPLARPHAALEGLDNCARCHDQKQGLSARLCLDCHDELAGRVARKSGFHGRLPESQRAACAGCHPDHRGRDLQMIEWEGGRDRFDHRQTGWPLAGAHARTRCEDCHQRRLLADADIRRLLERQPRRATFLGLSTRCDSCHFDEHRGQLGAECQSCHQEVAWKPVPRFDHGKTAFPLRGKHQTGACARCHPSTRDERTAADAFPRPRAADFLQMKPIEHGTCESCHEDPHQGSFGRACASCHSEAGWKIINVGGVKNDDFHDRTRFPLRGGHVGVACRSCHGPSPGRPARFKGLPFATCGACHEDAHLGQLRSAATGKPPDCAVCHTVEGFAPAQYELEQHASTRFPLEGSHQAASCRGCHPIDARLAARVPAAVRRKVKLARRSELWSFAVLRPRRAPQACAACHEDVHRGQFAQGPQRDGGAECQRCHLATAFSDLRFDHDRDSRFPLTGKHASTACAGCHPGQRPAGGGPPMVRYRPLATTCGACHADPHRGQFSQAADPGARGCEHCHQTASFQQTLFRHDDRKFTSFALEGKHAQVACQRCHQPVRLPGGAVATRYRPLPRECEGCHTDYHGGAFRGFEP
jgi:hypothetical protein